AYAQVNADLDAAIEKARASADTRERDRIQGELVAAQGRLASAEGVPAVLKTKMDDALRRGDLEGADSIQNEQASAERTIELPVSALPYFRQCSTRRNLSSTLQSAAKP